MRAQASTFFLFHSRRVIIVHLILCLVVLFSYSPTNTFVVAIHREDNSNYFLFIEPDPTKKSKEAVDDELTQSLTDAIAQSETGTSDYTNLKDKKGKFIMGASYRGFHFSEDGETSDVVDYLLPNKLITNSLALHYVRFYRSEIPKSEMKKLQQLHKFMTKEKRTKSRRKEL